MAGRTVLKARVARLADALDRNGLSHAALVPVPGLYYLPIIGG